MTATILPLPAATARHAPPSACDPTAARIFAVRRALRFHAVPDAILQRDIERAAVADLRHHSAAHAIDLGSRMQRAFRRGFRSAPAGDAA